MKSIRLLTVSVAVLVLVQIAPGGVSSKQIDSYLQDVLSTKASTEFVDAYVVLSDRLTYDDLSARTTGMERKARQAEVVRILKDHSAATRTEVESYLRTEEARGSVRNIQIIWAINTISFSATPDVFDGLAASSPLVEKIFFDPTHPREMLMDDNGISKYNTENGIKVESLLAPQPGLTLINAPDVWAEGDSGAGVIVANIDTGCDWDHPDLIGNIWNNLGEDANGNGRTLTEDGTNWDPGDLNGVDDDGNGLVDDLIGWDYVGNDKDPSGGASHGTSTSGIVAGQGAQGTQTGVAPRAKLMILEPSSESNNWVAMQYAIDKGADITTSSLSYKWYFSPKPNYPMWREMTDMELAAGMVHTNSTSNDGQFLSGAPIPYNISAPGNCPPSWLHPDQTWTGGLSSVIGCGNVDAGTDLIVSSSPYGPSAWEDIKSVHPEYPYDMPPEYQDYPYETAPEIGLLKPDVSSPGNGTTSLLEGGGYSSFSGTSGATPHVAGTAALLLGAVPSLEPADVSRIIQSTAVEKGATGKDPRYGAGRIDAYAAYLEATSGGILGCGDLTSFVARCASFSGMIQARVRATGDWTGTTVTISVDGTPHAISAQVKADGSASQWKYQEPATPGTHTISLKDPSGCYSDVVVDCGADQPGGWEWEDDASWGTPEVGTTIAPAETRILGNYPNPFNPSTTIRYLLADETNVTVKVFNMLGQEVATLVNGVQKAGEQSVVWHGTNNLGHAVSSGLYIYRIQAGNLVMTEKMMFMK